MAKVQWIGARRSDKDNSQSGPARLLNCYRQPNGGKFSVRGVLGTSAFATLPGVFMRAMKEVGGEIYAAHGGKVYKVAEDMTVTERATVANAADTTIEGNNGAITVAAGGDYYNIASDGTVTSPVTGAFSNVGSVSLIGQRTVITEKDGRRFGWSDAADSTTFDALNFATAEYEDDKIIRGGAIGGQYWIFSERSIERWYLSGSSDVAQFLLPVSGAAIETGLKSFGLFTRFPNGAFFVGDDGICYLVSGGQLRPISARGVETSIAQESPNRCSYYEDEGQKFCVVHFPNRPAWCYDISVNEWHERAEGESFGAWSAVAAVKAYGKSFVGTDLGGIYSLERNNVDASGPLIRRGISDTLETGRRFTIPRLQIQATTGNSNLTELDGSQRPARIALRMSKDRGKTWGSEKRRSLGKKGEHDTLPVFRRLGQFRRANAEFTISDEAEISIDAEAFVDVG